MASKITRKSCLTRPSEICLLVLFFISTNILILSCFQERILKTLKKGETPRRSEGSSYNQQITEHSSETVLTFEEDGRFGNLLLETATLLIIGKKLNTPVKILPQVGRKLSQFLSDLPAPTIDYREVSVQCLELERLTDISFVF